MDAYKIESLTTVKRKKYFFQSKSLLFTISAVFFLLAIFSFAFIFGVILSEQNTLEAKFSLKSCKKKKVLINFIFVYLVISTCNSSHETYNLTNNATLKNYKRFSVAADNQYCSSVGK